MDIIKPLTWAFREVCFYLALLHNKGHRLRPATFVTTHCARLRKQISYILEFTYLNNVLSLLVLVLQLCGTARQYVYLWILIRKLPSCYIAYMVELTLTVPGRPMQQVLLNNRNVLLKYYYLEAYTKSSNTSLIILASNV
jgi:hypothetical protein